MCNHFFKSKKRVTERRVKQIIFNELYTFWYFKNLHSFAWISKIKYVKIMAKTVID